MLEKPVVQAFVSMAHKRSYPPRHTIVHAGDQPSTLYLILEGSVSVVVEDADGREMVLAYLNPGEFFGEMCLFPDQKVRTAIVRTRNPTLVAEVGYQAFRVFNREHPDIMFEVAGQLAARLRDTSRRLRDLTFLDVAGRLARTLLELTQQPDSQQTPRGVVVRISRQELARIVGCSREMAGRVLKKLEEDGLVSTQGRSIMVASGGRLATYRGEHGKA
ncbi:MAG: cAMP-activated global transcriptional regulator CRP [Nevskia sp.]|nr:cAMP-activated global transcriptional regulator CRP [Nevskia sp.]